MRAPAALFLLLVLLSAGLPGAAAADPPREVVILVHEAEAEDEAPRTTIDGVTTVGPTTSAGAAYNRIQTAVVQRQATGTPYEAELRVGRGEGVWRVESHWTPTGARAAEEPSVRAALFRDDGTTRRFFVVDEAAGLIERGANGTLHAAVDLLPPRIPEGARLGIAVWLVAGGEVVQSAAWLPTDDVVTHQARKAVLIEHVTRDGCDPCGFADDALFLLAGQYGYRPEATLGAADSYLVPMGARAWTGLLLGVAAAVALTRRWPA